MKMADNAAPEPIVQLIRKIHTLSLRGIGGEADAAKTKLYALLAKHGLELEDVINDVVKTYEFIYRNDLDARLIIQCFVSLGNGYKTYCYRKGGRKLKKIGLDLTPAQYVDLSGMVDYYRAAFKKETARLFSAFVQQHKLYAPSTGEEMGVPISQEEMEQLVNMMNGLGEKSYSRLAGFLE